MEQETRRAAGEPPKKMDLVVFICEFVISFISFFGAIRTASLWSVVVGVVFFISAIWDWQKYADAKRLYERRRREQEEDEEN